MANPSDQTGLDDRQLARVAEAGEKASKTSRRDIASVLARRAIGSTTGTYSPTQATMLSMNQCPPLRGLRRRWAFQSLPQGELGEYIEELSQVWISHG